MSKFPKPLLPPQDVKIERVKRQKQLAFSIIFGIAVRFFIIALELVGVAIFDSSALLLDALATLFDVAASILLLVSIKLAAKPPDEDHPFGHGRYEPLAGFQIGILLLVVGGGLMVQQSFYLFGDYHAHPFDYRAWMIPLVAVILLEIAYYIMKQAAKKFESPALAADAAHYRVDSLNSLIAFFALLLAVNIPQVGALFDHIGAVCIAAFMCFLGIKASKANLNQLMDRIPHRKYFKIVRAAAETVEGIQATEKLNIQQYGPDAHVDIDVEVDPQLSVEKAHKLSQKVRLEIQKAWPAVRDVTVHIEPYYPDDH
jgi:cation diffusion facilitator family transporter